MFVLGGVRYHKDLNPENILALLTAQSLFWRASLNTKKLAESLRFPETWDWVHKKKKIASNGLDIKRLRSVKFAQ